MIRTTAFVICISAALLATPALYAQDLSIYRGFRFGMSLAAVAKQSDVRASEAKVIFQRPAVIQELEWRPQVSYTSPSQTDPVKGVLFSFYNGELYRIVVNYDRDRTQGLSDEDMIQGISAKYGTPTAPDAKIISSSPARAYSDSEKVIARWEDANYSLNLFRFSYGFTPGIVVFSKRLDALANAAIIEGNRLNEEEAPQRELDRLKKQAEEKDAAGQKARPANKANFRP